MLVNPIAFVFHPARLLVFMLGLVASLAAVSTLDLSVDDTEGMDASEITRVELLN